MLFSLIGIGQDEKCPATISEVVRTHVFNTENSPDKDFFQLRSGVKLRERYLQVQKLQSAGLNLLFGHSPEMFFFSETFCETPIQSFFPVFQEKMTQGYSINVLKITHSEWVICDSSKWNPPVGIGYGIQQKITITKDSIDVFTEGVDGEPTTVTPRHIFKFYAEISGDEAEYFPWLDDPNWANTVGILITAQTEGLNALYAKEQGKEI